MQSKGEDDFPDAVVIDNGSHTIKAGFAGDDTPRVIFGSVIGRNDRIFGRHDKIKDIKETYIRMEAKYRVSDSSLQYPINRGIITDWDAMEKVIT